MNGEEDKERFKQLEERLQRQMLMERLKQKERKVLQEKKPFVRGNRRSFILPPPVITNSASVYDAPPVEKKKFFQGPEKIKIQKKILNPPLWKNRMSVEEFNKWKAKQQNGNLPPKKAFQLALKKDKERIKKERKMGGSHGVRGGKVFYRPVKYSLFNDAYIRRLG